MQGNHSFNIYIAKKYSIEEALLLSHIHYWCEINKKNNKNFYEGKYWTYNSYESFTNVFIYMSPRQVRTVLSKLEDNGLIETGKFNKLSIDKTKWYTVTKKGVDELKKAASNGVTELSDDCQNGQMDCQNGQTQSDKNVSPCDKNVKAIPDINTNINSTENIYDSFPEPEDVEERVEKRTASSSQTVKHIAEVYCSAGKELRDKGKSIPDKLIPNWGAFTRIVNKKIKDGYSVQDLECAIRAAKNNDFCINTSKFSISCIFGPNMLDNLIRSSMITNQSVDIKKGKSAFVDKDRDYSNDEGAW